MHGTSHFQHRFNAVDSSEFVQDLGASVLDNVVVLHVILEKIDQEVGRLNCEGSRGVSESSHNGCEHAVPLLQCIEMAIGTVGGRPTAQLVHAESHVLGVSIRLEIVHCRTRVDLGVGHRVGV
jgi:hypothetical protein